MRKIIFYIVLLIVLVSCGKNEPVTTVNDVCGNTYKIVTIGTQTWMAENLRCNKYDTQSEAYNASWLTNNAIPTSEDYVYTPYYTDATDRTKWYSTEYSGNLSGEQIAKLGYLYNWAAAVGVENGLNQTRAFTGNRQGICPNGWHIPTRAEWQTLYDYIYNEQKLSSNVVGKYLKTTSGWYEKGNGHGTDNYNFAALPSGYANGSCVDDVGCNTRFWTATPDGSESYFAYYRHLYFDYDYLKETNHYKFGGRSVRCVKN